MKRAMVWMWEYPIEELDEKGKLVKRTEWRTEPRENTRQVRVAHYRYINHE